MPQLMRLGGVGRLGGSGARARWFTTAAWFASDGVGPALIADFVNNRYAVPALGPELVTNGTFDTDLTGWTTVLGAPSTWQLPGVARVEADGTNVGRLQQTLTLEVGKTYVASVNVVAYNGTAAGGIVVSTVPNSVGAAIAYVGTDGLGTKTVYFTAVVSTVYALITTNTSTAGSWTEYDNFSVREVLLGDVGPELILNGNFSSAATGNPATGWALGQSGAATAVISGGVLILTGDGTNAAYADQSFTTEIGATYTVIYQNSNGTPATVYVGTSQGGSQYASVASTTTNAWGTLSFVATLTTGWIRFQRGGVAASNIDNVSIRKWTARPTLRSATFSEMFTYTATSTTARTYIDASGMMRNDLAANQPRFTWQNGKRQLLLENASTNLCTYSDAIASAANGYGGSGIGTTINGALSPANTMTAALVTTQNWVWREDGSVNGTYTFSVWMKASAGTSFQTSLNIINKGTTPHKATTLVTVTDRWQRFEVTGTTDGASAGVRTAISNSPAGVTPPVGTCIWGWQVEFQSFASSTISTSGSAVNRAIETCQFSALALAVIGRPAISGAVQAQGYRAGTSASDVPVYWGNSGSRWFAGARSAPTARTSDGSTTVDVTPMSNYPTVPFRHAFAVNSGGIRIAINNTNSGLSTTLTSATMTRTLSYIGRAETTSGPVPGDGVYDHAVLYPTRISDAATQALGVVMS